ncbi:MAG: hypothetical protein GJ680_18560 [Alteromonadaceae bacterium]|nr:hypothetical protein [Alteromonadaceae bacterium]
MLLVSLFINQSTVSKNNVMADDRPEICMQKLLEQRIKEGKPLVVFQPATSSEEVVSALKKLIPEDKKEAVVLVDLSKVDK